MKAFDQGLLWLPLKPVSITADTLTSPYFPMNSHVSVLSQLY